MTFDMQPSGSTEAEAFEVLSRLPWQPLTPTPLPAEQNRSDRYAKFLQMVYDWEGFIPPDYHVIPLSGGYFTVVSSAVYVRVSRYNWRANVQRDQDDEILKVYAYRKASKAERKRGAPAYIYLHRFITGTVYTGRQTVVDHLNGDSLDNRDCNHRTTGQSSNQGNMATTARTTMGKLRGVKLVSHQRKTGEVVVTGYRGRIKVRGKEIYSRIAFSTEARAHRWYQRMHAVLFPVATSWSLTGCEHPLLLPRRWDEIPF